MLGFSGQSGAYPGAASAAARQLKALPIYGGLCADQAALFRQTRQLFYRLCKVCSLTRRTIPLSFDWWILLLLGVT